MVSLTFPGDDGGPATQAGLSSPLGVFVDGAGDLYIADYGHARIRRVDAATGVITTVAGNGERGFSGDGGLATQASIRGPGGVFVDEAGSVYIADDANHRIRRVDAATGVITTVAGNGEQGFSGDGGPAPQAGLSYPSCVFVDGAGNLFIADLGNHRIRRVDAATGVITTVVGNGERGFSGDGGPAIQARLVLPYGVFVDGAGSLYVADRGNNRIRKVDAGTRAITTVVADQLKQDQTATTFTLAPNYPNPFNPHTRIRYQLAQAGPISLTIYNLLGQRLRVLVHNRKRPGPTRWHGMAKTRPVTRWPLGCMCIAWPAPRES